METLQTKTLSNMLYVHIPEPGMTAKHRLIGEKQRVRGTLCWCGLKAWSDKVWTANPKKCTLKATD